MNRGRKAKAKEVVNLLDENSYLNQPLDIAVAFKRVDDPEKAHVILSRLAGQFDENFTYLENFAGVKIDLANKLFFGRRSNMHIPTIRRLQREARDLLQRAILLSPDNVSKGWCWFNLGRVKGWLRMPTPQVEEAFKNAVDLVPGERTFTERYERLQHGTGTGEDATRQYVFECNKSRAS